MYDINGKVYTDSPFVDEIVHNAKLILNGIVIKNSEIADASETEESIRESDIYVSIKRGNRKFELLNYTYEHMSQLGVFTEEEMTSYEIDNDRIPLEYRDQLFDIASKEFLNNYVELNDYYRMLNGLPNYGYEGLFLDSYPIPEDIKSVIDMSKPIHELDEYQIGLLDSYGILSKIRQDNPTDSYLLHLGSKRIDIFEARIAGKFDILYMPTDVEPIVANRFREIYEKERIIYFKRHYSLAYKFNSDYYDEFFIIMLLSQTVTDLVAEIPEWYIRRDIFDVRTVELLLESNGVKYFEEIPLKYQIALVRYLNKIVKYKSCNKNIYDLINIFDFNDAIVYKYYLVKDRLSDDENNYIISDNIKDMYELFFVKVPLEDSLIDSITDNTNIMSYNSIVTEDKWWNGPEDHDYVYESILKKNFTSQITKYMSLEVKYDIKDYQFQSMYFLNMIFNNKINTSDLRLEVPIINTSTTFTLRDLFVLLFVISFTYFNKDADGNILINNRDTIGTDLNFGKHPVGDYSILDPNTILPTYDDINVADGGYSPDEDPYLECNGGYAMDSEYDTVDGGLLKTINIDADGKYAWQDEEDLYDFNGGNYRNNRETVNANGNDEYPFNPIYNDHINPHIDLDPCFIFKDNFESKNLYEIDLSNRIYGFNPDADLDYLASVIGNYHSSYGFDRGYTLEELGVDKFITPIEGSISSPEELMNIYNTNKEVHDNLYEKIVDSNSEDEYRVYKFTFDYLFTMDMNKEFYTKNNGELATTYLEFLKDQNIILYNFYNQLMMEDNDDIRRSTISTYVDQIIDSIDLYINNDLEYLFYSISSKSWNSTMQYLSLLINFFKSYKVQFLDIGGTLVFSDEIEDSARPNDKIGAIDIELLRGDTYNTYDTIGEIESEFEFKDKSDTKEELQFEYDYGDTYYDLNGDTSSTKLSYIILNGNIEYIDDFKSFEDDYRIDVEDMEEELDWDGGNCSKSYSDDAFFDLDATDASYIEKYDDSYEEEYDWDGGEARFHKTKDIMDNGPAEDQRFYADYCPQDKEYRFPDEVNYDPRYVGIICDGKYAKTLAWYWQADALYSYIDDDPMYELDGGRCWILEGESYIQDVEIRNAENEKNNDINVEKTEDIIYCKVNPMFRYSDEYTYYTHSEYTGEMTIINNITAENYQDYLSHGDLYFTIKDEIHASEILLREYEEYTFETWI